MQPLMHVAIAAMAVAGVRSIAHAGLVLDVGAVGVAMALCALWTAYHDHWR